MAGEGRLAGLSAIITDRYLAAALAGLALLASADLSAQAYPAKPIRVVIPAAPGSNSDILFRIISPRMSATLGQQLLPDYRAGAGGVVGASVTNKSPADGYTIALVAAGFVMNPSVTKNMPYDPTRDFSPLGVIADVPAALVVHPSLPVRNVKELIALAKAKPGQLNFGSSGQGANSHLSGVLFNQMAKVKTVHVPYKSSSFAIIDLMAGNIELSFTSIPSVLEHARTGRLRMLAQTGLKRSPTAPDTPTMQEAGLPGFHVNSGFGLIGPPGLPRPVVERLNGALVKALEDPANRKLLLDSGADPVGNTPEEHDAFIKAEVARWKKLTQDAGIRPE